MNILNATDLHTRSKYGIAFAVTEIMTQTSDALSSGGVVSLISAGDSELPMPSGTVHYSAPRTLRWSGKWRYTPDYQRMCERIISEQDIAVMHIHGVWTHPTLAANRAALRRGIPTVLTNQGQLTPWALAQPGALGSLRKQLYLKLMNKSFFKTISVWHAVTPLERDELNELFPGCRIEVIPNAIDLSQADKEIASRPAPTVDSPYILFVGRLHPKKGVDLLIEAFNQAIIPSDWRLMIVGPAEDPKYVKQLHRAASAGARASAIEFREPIWDPGEKYALMRGSTVVVVPSYSEVVAFVNLEAAACGTPTITTPPTGLSDWQDGGGLLVEPTVEALTSALTVCGRWSDQERKQRGEASRRLVEQRYSTAATSRRWIELYSSLC
jgi:glycosyltransferase involved in cell wall biosynthesis